MTTTRRVTTPDGVELSVTDAGDGPVVLLVHGFPELAHSWRRQVAALADAGYRVLAPDMRGYGASDRPEVVTDYDIDHLTGDLVALLDDVGATQAVVVGHDWGSIVAWELAARHPAHVRTLTALSVPHPRAFGAALRDVDVQRAKSTYMQFFRSDPAKAAAVLLADGAAALRQVYGDDVHHRDVEEYVEHFSEPGALEASLYWYAAMGHMDTPEVHLPTTFVWGADDVAIGEVAARGCAEFCTGPYEFRPLEGRGHWLPDQDPDAVVDAILARAG